MTRFVIVGDFTAVPWVPIMAALWSGLNEIGHPALLVPMLPEHSLGFELFDQFAPEVTLFPIHHSERLHLPAWLEHASSTKRVALCYDDPYDMATPLAFLERFDHVLSPEPLAVESYRRRGKRADVLDPVIDGRMHYPPRNGLRQIVYDVLSVAGRQWRPRAQFMPQLEAFLKARGKTFGEIAGSRRWCAGRELTKQLHACRLTFDLPRTETFATTNPEGLPCTYPGPRLHIAAATRTPIVAIEPRSDTARQFPGTPRVPMAESFQVIGDLLDRPADLALIADANFKTWNEKHTPAIRAAELVDRITQG